MSTWSEMLAKQHALISDMGKTGLAAKQYAQEGLYNAYKVKDNIEKTRIDAQNANTTEQHYKNAQMNVDNEGYDTMIGDYFRNFQSSIINLGGADDKALSDLIDSSKGEFGKLIGGLNMDDKYKSSVMAFGNAQFDMARKVAEIKRVISKAKDVKGNDGKTVANGGQTVVNGDNPTLTKKAEIIASSKYTENPFIRNVGWFSTLADKPSDGNIVSASKRTTPYPEGGEAIYSQLAKYIEPPKAYEPYERWTVDPSVDTEGDVARKKAMNILPAVGDVFGRHHNSLKVKRLMKDRRNAWMDTKKKLPIGGYHLLPDYDEYVNNGKLVYKNGGQ